MYQGMGGQSMKSYAYKSIHNKDELDLAIQDRAYTVRNVEIILASKNYIDGNLGRVRGPMTDQHRINLSNAYKGKD
jgi:hypothetical protein